MAKPKKQESNVVELKRTGPAEDAVVALNLAKIKRANEALQVSKNEHQSVVKHAEAKGINLKAANWAIKLQKSGKLDEAVAELTARIEYAFILGTPITKAQLDLFRVEEPRTPGVEKAKRHGRYCGIMGMGTDQNPYAVESPQGQAWMSAFHGGTEERNLVLSMEPTEGSELMKGADEKGADDDVFDDGDEETSESLEAAE